MRLIIAVLVVLSAPLAAHAQEDQLSVSLEYQSCQQDQDCIVVPTHCGGCSCRAPVHRNHEPLYRNQYEARCAAYDGAVCDVYCPTPFALCQESRCALSASDPRLFEQDIPWLMSEADVIIAVDIRAIDTSSMPADGPMIVEATLLTVLKGRWSNPVVQFAASAWMSPTYRPGERRIVFLKQYPDADIARRNVSWSSLETGRLDAYLIGVVPGPSDGVSLETFFRSTHVSLRRPHS